MRGLTPRRFIFRIDVIGKCLFAVLVSRWDDEGYYLPYFGIEASYFKDFGGGFLFFVTPLKSLGIKFSNCLCGCTDKEPWIEIS